MPAGDFPIIRVFEFDTSELASPVGTRHIPGGSFAFKQRVALGCSMSDPLNPGNSSGILSFEGPKFEITDGDPPSHAISKTTAIIFNLGASGTAISDMKLFLVNDSAISQPAADLGIDPAFVQFVVSGVWKPGFILPSGAAQRLTTSVPEIPNIFRQDGKNVIATQDDANSSQFVYMNLIVPWGFPFDTFGACGSGLLRFGLIFSYYNGDYILEFGAP